MKIIYKSVFEKIREAYNRARVEKMDIEKIILSEPEWGILKDELRSLYDEIFYSVEFKSENKTTIFGIKIEVEE